MKPVLIQHLIKHNKGKYKPAPISQEEHQRLNDRAASVVIWFLGIIVLIGLFAS